MPLPQDLQKQVFHRDGWICRYCDEDVGSTPDVMWRSRPTIDHFLPTTHGGTNDPGNLLTACASCNLKGNRQFATLAEARAWLGQYKAGAFTNWHNKHGRPGTTP